MVLVAADIFNITASQPWAWADDPTATPQEAAALENQGDKSAIQLVTPITLLRSPEKQQKIAGTPWRRSNKRQLPAFQFLATKTRQPG